MGTHHRRRRREPIVDAVDSRVDAFDGFWSVCEPIGDAYLTMPPVLEKLMSQLVYNNVYKDK
uniref:Uncharacterized protein n=1 Tax=Picea glauca TaxID=3330 RepID=A0A101LV30_PICGL|nr:hypothetical protein ABT39_MTgene2253 [Picea glauca]QHR86617.1 hypothetical protein Q903MT_gene620 [Picea sitchensis]